MSRSVNVARPLPFRSFTEADVGGRRTAIGIRAYRVTRAANDNRPSFAHRLDRLWPVVTALLVLAWLALSFAS